MTWREAIENLGPPDMAHFDAFELAFRERNWYLSDYDEFDRRFKKHWIKSWICTDSRVGIAVITLDGEPVAISSQTARKADEEIEFISEELGAKVVAAIETMVHKPIDTVVLVNLDASIDERWFEHESD